MTNVNMADTTTTAPAPIKHRDAKIADLNADIADLRKKIERKEEQRTLLEQEAANEQAISELAEGSKVAYLYGRALNKRVLQGTVRYVGTNDKNVTQLKVETGEGLDAEFNLIDASALLLTVEQVEAAQAEIDKAKADAEAAASATQERQA